LGRLLLIFRFVVDFDLKETLNWLPADGAPGGLVPQNLGTLTAHALQQREEKKSHGLGHTLMQHYISSRDTENNHRVGNLGSISVQRKWKLHFSGLRIWKKILKIIIWLGIWEADIIEA
jgi:hypothetical protein